MNRKQCVIPFLSVLLTRIPLIRRLLKTYSKHLAWLRKTREGVGSEDEPGVIHNECLIPADGPDQTTPEYAVNIWSEFILATYSDLTYIHNVTEQIHNEFPWFAALHRILSSRPNVVPPAIVTGVGPAGREIVYNDPPPPSQGHNSNIDPRLYALGPNNNLPPLSPPTHSLNPARSASPTPLFTQPGILSQPLPSSRPVSRAASSQSQKMTTISAQPNLTTMIAKAKQNVKVQPPKRSFEDTLSEGIS